MKKQLGTTLYRSYEAEYSDFPSSITIELTTDALRLIDQAQQLLKDNPEFRAIKIDYDGELDQKLIDYGIGTRYFEVHENAWWLYCYGKFDSSLYAEFSLDKPEDYEEENDDE